MWLCDNTPVLSNVIQEGVGIRDHIDSVSTGPRDNMDNNQSNSQCFEDLYNYMRTTIHVVMCNCIYTCVYHSSAM